MRKRIIIMTRPDFVTLTGADDRTDPAELLNLSARYPGTEFGILLSAQRAGTARYPNPAWIDRIRGRGLRLAAHVCGALAHEIVSSGRSLIDPHLHGFSRIQINTARPVDIDLLLGWRDRVSGFTREPLEVILQCRESFPQEDRISWLFDRSGGRGDRPEFWPEPPGSATIRHGYAGGIGPETLVETLRAIPAQGGFWIDMESRIRDTDDRFSPDLCRQVLETVQMPDPHPPT